MRIARILPVTILEPVDSIDLRTDSGVFMVTTQTGKYLFGCDGSHRQTIIVKTLSNGKILSSATACRVWALNRNTAVIRAGLRIAMQPVNGDYNVVTMPVVRIMRWPSASMQTLISEMRQVHTPKHAAA